jgi:hypothetical protein
MKRRVDLKKDLLRRTLCQNDLDQIEQGNWNEIG